MCKHSSQPPHKQTHRAPWGHDPGERVGRGSATCVPKGGYGKWGSHSRLWARPGFPGCFTGAAMELRPCRAPVQNRKPSGWSWRCGGDGAVGAGASLYVCGHMRVPVYMHAGMASQYRLMYVNVGTRVHRFGMFACVQEPVCACTCAHACRSACVYQVCVRVPKHRCAPH